MYQSCDYGCNHCCPAVPLRSTAVDRGSDHSAHVLQTSRKTRDTGVDAKFAGKFDVEPVGKDVGENADGWETGLRGGSVRSLEPEDILHESNKVDKLSSEALVQILPGL